MIPGLVAGLVVPQGKDPIVIVFFVEEALARRESWVKDIRTYQLDDKDIKSVGDTRRRQVEVVANVVRELGLARGRIGIEKDSLPITYFEQLSALLPQATFVAADQVLERTRAIKTDAEIEILRWTARATENAMLEFLRNSRVGDTERKVADDMRSRLFLAGADSVWMTLGAGPNGKVFHQPPACKGLDAWRISTLGRWGCL